MKILLQNINNDKAELDVNPESTCFEELRNLAKTNFNYSDDSDITLIHQAKILTFKNETLSSYPKINEGSRIIVIRKNCMKKKDTSNSQTHIVNSDVDDQKNELIKNCQTQEVNSFVDESKNTEKIKHYSTVGNSDPSQKLNDDSNNKNEIKPNELNSKQFPSISENTEEPNNLNISSSNENNVLDASQQLAMLTGIDPALVPSILQSIGQKNSTLLDLLNRDPATFAHLLDSLVEESSGNSTNLNSLTSQLSEEDEQAITRLCELGFSREAALEAYISCDKDENSAANFLFDN